jgi:hypothetical protein
MDKQLYLMFKKNLKILVNNKISFTILFLGPILLLLLMTLMYYNENSYSFQIGVVNGDSGEIQIIIEDELDKNGFLVVPYMDREDCVVSLQEARIQSCIIYPQELLIEKGSENEIIILVDNSKAQVKEVIENILRTTLQGGSYAISKKNIETVISNLELLEDRLEYSKVAHENNKAQLASLDSILDDLYTQVLTADLAYNSESLDLGGIALGIDNILSSKENFISSTEDNLLDSFNLLNNLSGEIEMSNLSESVKNDLDDKFDEAYVKLDLTIRQFSSFGSSSYSFNKFESDLTSLIETLDEVDIKLEKSFEEQGTLIELGYDQTKLIKQNLSHQNLLIENDLAQTYSFSIRDADILLTPVSLSFEDAFKSSSSKLGSLFPFIFGTLILLLSLFLGSVLSFKEKTSQSCIRNTLAAPSSIKVVIAQILSVVVLLYAQISVIAVLFYVTFIKAFYLDLAILLLLLFLFLIVFVALGIFIGQFVVSQLSLFITLLLTLFVIFLTSGVMLPLELLDATLVLFLEYLNPYLAMQSILRKILLFSVPIQAILFELGVLVIGFLVMFIITVMMNSYYKRGEVYYMFHKMKKKVIEKKKKEN